MPASPIPASPLSGLIVVDKPYRMRSTAVVSLVKRRANGARTGHAGTLDPLATGVLLVVLGQATKSIERLMATDKRYVTRIDLSAFTTTDDLEGERIEVDVSAPPDAASVKTALERFVGTIDQRPPIYSAVKIAGRRAYKLARSGKPVTPDPRPVTIHGIQLCAYDWPHLELAVHCAKGVYIRSLAHDIGEALGVGGHCVSLRRTAVGPFTDAEALHVDAIPEPLTQQDLVSRDTALARVGA
jgi:tRNA pseudouridine55 synthase